MNRKLEIAAFILSAVMQVATFAYFLGGIEARLTNVEQRLSRIEEHFLIKQSEVDK